MKPVSPVIPGYEELEVLVGVGQPQYIPLPTLVSDTEDKRFISRWEFSELEREQVAAGGSLVLEQLTFGLPFHPVALSIQSAPEIDPNEQVQIPERL